MSPFGAVVTDHVNGFGSGVARFNELLAQRLGIPLLRVGSSRAREVSMPLLSFKVSQLDRREAAAVEALIDGGREFSLFLHELCGSGLEARLVESGRTVYCGNDEIAASIRSRRPDARALWAPGLLTDSRPLERSELTVFSFGMAHKLQLGMFERLRDLLGRDGRSFTVYVSAAHHETASLKDAASVFADLHAVLGGNLFFLGTLSDVVVHDWLTRSDLFASFFPGGVRANNTSVAAAIERGCTVMTNLDRYSPIWLRHMETVIDVERCTALPPREELRAIGARALGEADARGWDALVERLRT